VPYRRRLYLQQVTKQDYTHYIHPDVHTDRPTHSYTLTPLHPSLAGWVTAGAHRCQLSLCATKSKPKAHLGALSPRTRIG
jgi:hypothetical protein